MSDHQYIESMSGPPRLVDGPGCTPAVVPDCSHAETCCKEPGVCTHDCTPAVANEPPDQADPAEFIRCGKCRQPFDPNDTRWDGKAQYHDKPYCRSCLDICHDNEIADHRCPICDPGPRNIPIRAKVGDEWGNVTLSRLEWEASRAAALQHGLIEGVMPSEAELNARLFPERH